MDLERRNEASVDTPRAQTEAVKLRSKGSVEFEDELDEALKGVDWKLLWAYKDIKRNKKRISV